MSRIRLPARPDMGRVQQARVAASRVAQASASSAIIEEIVAVETSIRTDYDAALQDIGDRLDALEP